MVEREPGKTVSSVGGLQSGKGEGELPAREETITNRGELLNPQTRRGCLRSSEREKGGRPTPI